VISFIRRCRRRSRRSNRTERSIPSPCPTIALVSGHSPNIHHYEALSRRAAQHTSLSPTPDITRSASPIAIRSLLRPSYYTFVSRATFVTHIYIGLGPLYILTEGHQARSEEATNTTLQQWILEDLVARPRPASLFRATNLTTDMVRIPGLSKFPWAQVLAQGLQAIDYNCSRV
jgi:hypothetical protein